MTSPWRRTAAVRYAAWGAIFGLCFPLVATAMTVHDLSLPWTASGWATAQTDSPLLWIIDTAPLWLGLFAYVAGRRQDIVTRLVESLEGAVAERTEHLEVAVDAAASASRAKSAFLLAMSHDLRTPLNSVIGFSGVLLNEKQRSRAQETEYLSRIRKSAIGLLNLVNGVLEMAQLETGDVRPEMYRASLRDIIEDATATLPSETGELAVDWPADDLVVRCDRTYLSRAIRCLLENALGHSSDAVQLKIVEPTQASAPVVIEVWDDGTTLSRQDAARIFEPFPESGVTTRSSEALDLRLPISHSLCARMGFILDVQPGEDHGAVFRVRIPAAAVGPRSTGPEPS